MRYVVDPTQDTAGFPILPKGEYRLKIGEPKAFKGETKQGENKGQINYGVGFMCTVIDGPVDNEGNVSPVEHKGKKVYNRLFYHTQESRNYSKTFVIAAFGYSQKEEEQFNEKIKEIKEADPDNPAVDWSFDADTGECGEAWRGMVNSEVVAALSVDKVDGVERQKWDMVRPAPSAPEREVVTENDVATVNA